MVGSEISFTLSAPATPAAKTWNFFVNSVSFIRAGGPASYFTSASPRIPSATLDAMARIRSSTKARVAGLRVRTVPSMVQLSAMMLKALPPSMRPMVSTAGSRGESSRLRMVWSSRTAVDVMVTGSTARWGWPRGRPCP